MNSQQRGQRYGWLRLRGPERARCVLARLKTYLLAALVVSSSSVAKAQLSSKETQAAKRIYSAKCAKCHKFYDPNAYQQDEWAQWMQKMSKKSKLKPDQSDLLSRYIDTLRNGKKSEAK